jgi:putative dehydrogenase
MSDTTNQAGTIGFVGLGAMGLPMALNLLKSGYVVRGFDLNPASLTTLSDAGGVAVGSAAEAATGAETLIVMVVNAAQVEAVLFASGAAAALTDGGTIIVTATCAPTAVEQIAAKVEAMGRRLIDAPVSGGVAGATAGSLTMMVAAPDTLFAELRPVLDVMGGKVVHVGTKPGQGAVVKSVNQLLAGVHIAATGEALALAGKMGIDLAVMLDIVSTSAASSWMLKDRGPRMLEENPEVRSAVDIFVKDLGIVMEAGREAKAALPLAAIAHQMFLAASGQGRGKQDDSQVIRAYDVLNGR